ncbi:MAG: lactate racemase domain-containing protein [Planctomycetota bacterium]
MSFPRFFRVRQDLPSHAVPSIDEALVAALSSSEDFAAIGERDAVAIAVGSRGIDRIEELVACLARSLKARGAEPFIVPAMGSHGGATADGQERVLSSLGITESLVKCPIRSSLETVKIGESGAGHPILFDAVALQADHIIPINRVKLHTRLLGKIQSGLCKMLMVGMGNHLGAQAYHPLFEQYGYQFERLVDDVVPQLISSVPLACGIAVIEDAHKKIAEVECASPRAFLEVDRRLLTRSIGLSAKLPVRSAELLIIDEIGKEISGTGMDTNVVGRKWNDKLPAENEWPKIREIYVRSLTERSAGNANGIGIAEYTRRCVTEDMDPVKTRVNCVTAAHPTSGAVPIWFDNDREVLDAVCQQSSIRPDQRRWLRIRNTLDLAEVECSEAILPELQTREDLTILSKPAELLFDAQQNLVTQ